MALPSDRNYTQDHLWIKPEGDAYIIGITETALELMGEVNQLQFTLKTGLHKKESVFCSIESEKTVIDLVTPAKGEILELNQGLENDASPIPAGPYDTWIIKMSLDANDYEKLFTSKEYQNNIK